MNKLFWLTIAAIIGVNLVTAGVALYAIVLTFGWLMLALLLTLDVLVYAAAQALARQASERVLAEIAVEE